MATRRTTMRSRSGTKLYAVRDEGGKFKDIQTYKRAHAADMRHKSKAEIEAAQGPHRKEGEKNGECCREVHQEFGDGHGCCSAERSETSCEAGFKPLASIEKMVKKTAKKTTGKPTAKRTAKKAGKK